MTLVKAGKTFLKTVLEKNKRKVNRRTMEQVLLYRPSLGITLCFWEIKSLLPQKSKADGSNKVSAQGSGKKLPDF